MFLILLRPELLLLLLILLVQLCVPRVRRCWLFVRRKLVRVYRGALISLLLPGLFLLGLLLSSLFLFGLLLVSLLLSGLFLLRLLLSGLFLFGLLLVRLSLRSGAIGRWVIGPSSLFRCYGSAVMQIAWLRGSRDRRLAVVCGSPELLV